MQPLPPPRPRRWTAGRILTILAVAFFICIALLGVGAYLLRDEIAEAVKLYRRQIEISLNGLNAPGVAEIKRLGCGQASVYSVSELLELSRNHWAYDVRPEQQALMVICGVHRGASPPSCSQVAKTFLGAVGTASGPFTVVVQLDTLEQICLESYGPDGSSASPHQ
jgi:hypothetical protein